MIVHAGVVELEAPDEMPAAAREAVARLRLCATFGFIHERAVSDLAAVENHAFGHDAAARLRLLHGREDRLAAVREVMRRWGQWLSA